MKRFLIIGLTLIIFSAASGEVVINEVMSNPAGSESSIPGGDSDEFIELYNTGEDTVDLSGYSFSDGDATDDILPWTLPGLIDTDVTTGTSFLPPGGYAVILDPEYVDERSVQPYDFPAGTIVLTVGNTTLGNGLSNNDPVFLIAPSGDTVSTYTYPLGGDDGYSIERIRADLPDTPDNWSQSVAPTGSTPGGVNSVTPLPSDLAALEISFSPDNPAAGFPFEVAVSVTNAGTSSFPGGWLFVVADTNEMTLFDSVIDSVAIPAISPSDTETIPFSISLDEGLWFVGVALPPDDRDENNRISRMVLVGERQKSLIFFEIQACPASPEPEWIEFRNISFEPVSLLSWGITDHIDTVYFDVDDTIGSGDFFIITQDSSEFRNVWTEAVCQLYEPESWLTLNNTGDSLFLLDEHNFEVESVIYTSDWFSGCDRGVSLERVDNFGDSRDKGNWWCSRSPDGATPCRENTTPQASWEKVLMNITPNPFDPRQEQAAIELYLPREATRVTLKVYDLDGRLVRIIADNERASTLFHWDGKDKRGKYVLSGVYVIFARIEGDRVFSVKRSVVVGRRR